MKNTIEFNKLEAIAINMGSDTKNCKNIEDLKKKIQIVKLKNIIMKRKENLLKKRNKIKDEELEQIKKEIKKFLKISLIVKI